MGTLLQMTALLLSLQLLGLAFVGDTVFHFPLLTLSPDFPVPCSALTVPYPHRQLQVTTCPHIFPHFVQIKVYNGTLEQKGTVESLILHHSQHLLPLLRSQAFPFSFSSVLVV